MVFRLLDKCCLDRKILQDILGEEIAVKQDIFHLAQRVGLQVPKKSCSKSQRSNFLGAVRDIFRQEDDRGPTRLKATPNTHEMTRNCDLVLSNEFLLRDIPASAVRELTKVRAHIANGCVS